MAAIASPATTTYAGLAADHAGRSDERAPVVLLHGYTFDRTMWRSVMVELERVDPGRRVVALDLPGHGESPDASSYLPQAVLDSVRAAVVDAGLDDPVIVGHSGAAGTAAMYGAAFPARGVVTVDGSMAVGGFARMFQGMRDALEGPGFHGAWAAISAGAFGLEELGPNVRSFVVETSKPRQDVLLGYWRYLLHHSPDEVQAMVDGASEIIRQRGVPFVNVTGHEPSPNESAWLAVHLPEARTLVWPHSGHFPHLAHPHRFAKLLAESSTWVSNAAVAATGT